MAKEVRYDIYCKHCEFFAVSPSDHPCTKCLAKPDNEGSHTPVLFKKVKPLINYLIDGETLPDRWTRDHANSRNWKNGLPDDKDLKKYFKVNSKDGDWYEKED